jgi:hypothetical protein
MLRCDVQGWKDLAQSVERGQPDRSSPASRWETLGGVAKYRLDLVINIEYPNLGSGTGRSTHCGSPAFERNIAHATSAVCVYAHQLAATRATDFSLQGRPNPALPRPARAGSASSYGIRAALEGVLADDRFMHPRPGAGGGA